MNWVVFSYSLPSQPNSSARVTAWRRLKRIGAVALKTGPYVLPDKDDCVESFQWLAQEITGAGGEAVVIHATQFDSIADNDLVEIFRENADQQYSELLPALDELAKAVRSGTADLQETRDSLARLQRRLDEISSGDYFQAKLGNTVKQKMLEIQKMTSPTPLAKGQHKATDYKSKKWVTRPKPHVDRLACIWLIRKFINARASIRYSHDAQPKEVSFDMKDATFGHKGNLCSFEHMIAAFGLNDSALSKLGQIVHDIDLHENTYAHPETAGIEAILRSWRTSDLSDQELERRGQELFESLYETFASS